MLRVSFLAAGAAMLLADGAAAQPTPATPWQIQFTQVDKTGTLVGEPHLLACPPGGCQGPVDFDIEGKARSFLAVVTFVQRGAYVGLTPTTKDVRKIVEFEKGFQGPIFIPLRSDGAGAQTLRFTLTGSAVAESEQTSTKLMQNDRSLVFHRKLEPDLVVKVSLTRAGAG